MTEFFRTLPLPAQWSMGLIAASLLLCVIIYGLGWLLHLQSGAAPSVIFSGSSFPTWGDELYTLLFMLLYGASCVLNVVPGLLSSCPFSLPCSGLVVSAVATVLIYVPMLIRFALLPKSQEKRLRPLAFALYTLLGLVLILLANGFCAYFNLTIPLPAQAGVSQDVVQMLNQGTATEQLVLACSAALIAPFTEEVCFRGFLYNILKKHATPWAAAIGSSFVFAAIHTSLPQLLPLFIFALVQCWAYEKARRLTLPITIHAVFNGLTILAFLAG